MRQLKHHEQKLLKKVDFLQWKKDDSIREIKIIRRYYLQKREDYHKYSKIAGSITQLANGISLLDSRDPFRAVQEKALLDKLYGMGIISSTSKFSDCNKVTVSAFCRRRLPIVMCRLKMAETVKEAVTFVEQGHIRVGPQTITDPAFLVNCTMEDFVTWVDTSKIKQKFSSITTSWTTSTYCRRYYEYHPLVKSPTCSFYVFAFMILSYPFPSSVF
ncbi:unnamed protein product [Absidia cylindrospora]